MIEIVTDQKICDKAFRCWVAALEKNSEEHGRGKRLKNSLIIFGNYGHGDPGTINDEVMLGSYADDKHGIVKIVRPIGQNKDKKKLTILGRDVNGNLLLLRQGWLKPNNFSGEVKEKFSNLSGLSPLTVQINGQTSKREYFLVANLSEKNQKIASMTVDFTNGCLRARVKTGGKTPEKEQNPYSQGADEKGGMTVVNHPSWNKEVWRLQGYVWKSLKDIFGNDLQKPTRNGYAVDALFPVANLLVEIKTSASTSSIYEAVGQLKLYPHIIGLDKSSKLVLLIPDFPPIRNIISKAVAKAGIELYTYSIKADTKPPTITISDKFIERCRNS